MKTCLRDPVPEIALAAQWLDEAVSAHLAGDAKTAEDLIRRADLDGIRDWTDSLWGKNSPYVPRAFVIRDKASHTKFRERMPKKALRAELLTRDGYHCRFCGIPLVRKEVRQRIYASYPAALRWGRRNIEQHAAFQAMAVNYDHILPHSKGGETELANLVITCAPCNYARMELTLEQAGLADPRDRPPKVSKWDGLSRFR